MHADKQVKYTVVRVIVICAVLVAVAYGLSNWLGASNFGKEVITLKDGSKVYAIHEQWGLHSDRISLTQNPDGCRPPDPTTDYVDTYGNGLSIVYSLTEDGLIIYDGAGPTSMDVPSKPWGNIKVEIRKTRALSDILRAPYNYGVIVLKVPLNEVCWKNLFRSVGTSLSDAP